MRFDLYHLGLVLEPIQIIIAIPIAVAIAKFNAHLANMILVFLVRTNKKQHTQKKTLTDSLPVIAKKLLICEPKLMAFMKANDYLSEVIGVVMTLISCGE